jgi:hypothetical protein
MKSTIACLLAVATTVLPSLVFSKEVPPSKYALSTQVDALFVGHVRDVRRISEGALLIDIEVKEKIFDRRRDVAESVIVNVLSRDGLVGVAPGNNYVFSAGTCANGAHVVFGKQFIFPFEEKYVVTPNSSGLQERMTVPALRKAFSRLGKRDPFMTSETCKEIFRPSRARTNKIQLP